MHSRKSATHCRKALITDIIIHIVCICMCLGHGVWSMHVFLHRGKLKEHQDIFSIILHLIP